MTEYRKSSGDSSCSETTEVEKVKIKIRGRRGHRGCRGHTGATGATGATGQMGNTGETGSMGNTGATGSMGNTGSMGQMGNTGSTGQMGNTGATGSTGSMGNTGATGSVGANAASPIPFSSGIVATINDVSTTSGIVFGFGANRVIAPTPGPNSGVQTGDKNVMTTQFAWSVPGAGTLSNFQASVDGTIVRASESPITYTFFLCKSSSTNGVSHAPIIYSAIATVTVTITSAAGFFTVSEQALGSVPVSTGDRIVIYVLSNNPTPSANLEVPIAFSAGIFYTKT